MVSARAVYLVSALAILACVTALVTPRPVQASPACGIARPRTHRQLAQDLR
jgi:hypothetical protein